MAVFGGGSGSATFGWHPAATVLTKPTYGRLGSTVNVGGCGFAARWQSTWSRRSQSTSCGPWGTPFVANVVGTFARASARFFSRLQSVRVCKAVDTFDGPVEKAAFLAERGLHRALADLA